MRPCVLVFAGHDPSGGAGIGADIEAIAANGAHALTVVTALTVQDNNRVHAVHPVAPELLLHQARVLIAGTRIAAVKIGICGSVENAKAIATAIGELPTPVPVVLDPVLASGHGDALARGDALAAIRVLLPLATVLVPNLPEAQALGETGCEHVLLTGGHSGGEEVVNRWRDREWRWPRLQGEFHGSGCTLASAIAAHLARGEPVESALEQAQIYTNRALMQSFEIAPGQRIPQRF